MSKASDLKRGEVIAVNGTPYVIRQIDVQSPSARGAATLYRVRASAVQGGQKFEERFKGDDDVTTLEMNRRAVNFSYADGNEYVFMDADDFSQYPLQQADIEEELPFVTEETEGLHVMLVDGQVIGLSLPANVVLEITECAPAMKAASASARTKPATLSTGLVVQVPEYIEAGERIKVSTSDRKFVSRA
ncbi:MAG: elongation factor P-like protein YeiP [Alcanivoracaceae bacterium]